MPEYLTPGVYVEETGFRAKAIEGVSVGTAAFIGPAREGPFASPVCVTGWTDFERTFGDAQALAADPATAGAAPRPNFMAHAVRAYFGNGGRRLYVVRVPADAANGDERGVALGYTEGLAPLAAVDATDLIGTVAAPGSSAYTSGAAVRATLIAFAERPGSASIAVLDSGPGHTPSEVRQLRATLDSSRAALYYPWVTVADPAVPGGEITLPPSGFMAGLYAANDASHGVHRSPANLVVRGALRFERDITLAELDLLNPDGVNCLRHMPGRGNLVWGARLVSSDPAWRYVAIRRLMNHLTASIVRGTAWAVFEPNTESLWRHIQQAVGDFLNLQWRAGALLGAKPEQAYLVRCDATTMTQNDIDNGRLLCEVGVAPVRPAEFVFFRIGQWTADAAPGSALPWP